MIVLLIMHLSTGITSTSRDHVMKTSLNRLHTGLRHCFRVMHKSVLFYSQIGVLTHEKRYKPYKAWLSIVTRVMRAY